MRRTTGKRVLERINTPHKSVPYQEGRLIAFSRSGELYHHNPYGFLPDYYLEYAVARELINTDIAQRLSNYPSAPSVLIIKPKYGRMSTWTESAALFSADRKNGSHRHPSRTTPYRENEFHAFTVSTDPRTEKETVSFSERGFLGEIMVDPDTGIHLFEVSPKELDEAAWEVIYTAAKKFFDFVFVSELDVDYSGKKDKLQRSKMPYLPPGTHSYQTTLASPEYIKDAEEKKKGGALITPVWFTRYAGTMLTLPGTEQGKPWQTLWGVCYDLDENRVRYTAHNVAAHILGDEDPHNKKALTFPVKGKEPEKVSGITPRMRNVADFGALGFGGLGALGFFSAFAESAAHVLAYGQTDIVALPYTVGATVISGITLFAGNRLISHKKKTAEFYTKRVFARLLRDPSLPEVVHPARTPVGAAAGLWSPEEEKEIKYIPTVDPAPVPAPVVKPQRQRRRFGAVEAKQRERAFDEVQEGSYATSSAAVDPTPVPVNSEPEPVILPIAQVKRRIETLRDEWMDYELNPEKLLAAPLIADVSAEPTAKFFMAMKNLESWEREWESGSKDIRMLNQALSAAELAFSQAVYHARKMQLSHLDAAQRKKIHDAKPLIRMLKSNEASPHEKIAAYRSAERMLEGILPLPEKAIMGLISA